MTTHVICSRCGKPMRPVVSDGTDAPTQGFCFCPPSVGWGHYTLAPVDWRDAELARLRADLAEARAALDRATESKPFSQHDELKQLRTSNHYMTEELTRLRAEHAADFRELAEARADVQRFEAALDVSQRELAEARKERERVYDDNERTRYDIWVLANKYEEKWVNVDPRGVAEDIKELLHVGDSPPLIERSRRTIRALVVAARCAYLQLVEARGAGRKMDTSSLVRLTINGYRIVRNQTTHD